MGAKIALFSTQVYFVPYLNLDMNIEEDYERALNVLEEK